MGRPSKNASRRRLLKAAVVAPVVGAVEPVFARPAAKERHVAVIGAGAFGGWTALHLLRGGAKVTLVDAWGAGHSRASSGGETRVIRSLYGPDRIYVDLVDRSFDLWEEARQRWRVRLYNRTGALWMFSGDDSAARLSVPFAREAGYRVDELPVADAARRFPQVRFDGVQKVYFEHDAGYLLARRACEAVRAGFVAEGGTYRRALVRAGAVEASRMAPLALSDGSRLEADAYVFACGPWLGRVFPDVIGERVRSTRQEVHFFGSPSGDSSYSVPGFPCWFDFDEQGRILYGIPGAERRGFKVADDSEGPPFDPTTGDRTPTAAGIDEARAFLARRFPGLAEAPIVEARVCQYAMSPDGHFIVDRHPEAENTWIVGGGSGHGFKLGPALGEHVAARVLGEKPIDPFFALARFERGASRGTAGGEG